MGVWGAGLYQSDVALDLKGAFRDARALGFSGERLATLALDMAGAADGEDADLASLVVADLLWREGMLDGSRREAALTLAVRPEGVLPFDDAKLARAHAKALSELATRLATPQRVRTKPNAEPYVEDTDLEVGEALALPGRDGKWWLLRVVTHYTRFGGHSPVVEVLDWSGRKLPDAEAVTKLKWRRQPDAVVIGSAMPAETLSGLIDLGRLPAGAVWDDYESQMAAPHVPVIRGGERDPAYRKVVRLGVKVPATRPFTSDWFIPTNAWTRWKDLSTKLEGYFGEWPGNR